MMKHEKGQKKARNTPEGKNPKNLGRDFAFTALANCDTYVRADGMAAIFILVRVDGHRRKIPLKIYTDPKNWNPKTRLVKPVDKQAEGINMLIRQAVSHLNDIAINYRLGGERLTAQMVLELYASTPKRWGDFITWMEAECVRKSQTLKKTTAAKHRETITKLRRCFSAGLPFGEFTYKCIERFEQYLHIEGLRVNTRTAHMKRLKIYTNRALREGYIDADPYEFTRMSYMASDREALDRDELSTLEAFYQVGTRDILLAQTLRCFLFSCYTGLRIGDLSQVCSRNIINGQLVIAPEKTLGMEKIVRIPLSEKAQKYLNGSSPDMGFELTSDQVMNKKLKIAAQACGIRKKLTYHVSRHTFATLFLESGGAVEVLQKLLGHSKIETTMIYVHISDKRKKEQVGWM